MQYFDDLPALLMIMGQMEGLVIEIATRVGYEVVSSNKDVQFIRQISCCICDEKNGGN